ncbi:uncharacterized protein LOC141898625 [Tubulanus polymorphus]|uniref:uncharacterized protein LOC141898625 n=1 Tax=Tubulanus polymorphus TaxID=672921 RepID=UPI003DA51DDB
MMVLYQLVGVVTILAYPTMSLKNDPNIAIDVAIVIDTSKTVYSNEFIALKLLAEHMVSQFSVTQALTRVATVEYSSTVRLGNWLQDATDAKSVNTAIKGLAWDGLDPHPFLAIDFAREHLFKEKGARGNKVPKVMIIIGSGEAADAHKTRVALREAYEANIRVYSIGHRSYSNIIESVLPPDHETILPYVLLSSTSEKDVAPTLVDKILGDATCDFGKYLKKGTCTDIDECAAGTNPCVNGGVCTNTFPGYTCDCPTPLHQGTTCTAMAPLDLTMVLDVSSAVYKAEWPKLFDLYKSIIRHFYVHPDHVQIAMFTAAATITNGALLNTCHSQFCLLNIMKTWKWTGEDPPDESMEKTILNTIRSQYGSRKNVPHAVIYVGSGVTTHHPATTRALNLIWGHKVRFYGVFYANSFSYLSKLIPNSFTFNSETITKYDDIFETAVSVVRKVASDVSCKPGYEKKVGAVSCTDVNECEAGKVPCFNSGTCINTVGRFLCQCSAKNEACTAVGKADIAMLLDSSASFVSAVTWNRWLTFYMEMISRFYVHPSFIRIASAIYSDTLKVATRFNDCDDATCVLSAITTQAWKYEKGGRKLGVALEEILKRLLEGPSGIRNAPKVLVYIGKGLSNDDQRVTQILEKYWRDGIKIFMVGPSNTILSRQLPSHAIVNFPAAANLKPGVGDATKMVTEHTRCHYGYYMTAPGKCTDIDECKAIQNPCHNGGVCQNTDGSYLCPCAVNAANCLERVQLDVAVYLDTSAAFTAAQFTAYRTVFKKIIKHFGAHRDFVRISASTFDSKVTAISALGACNSSSCILDLIAKSPITQNKNIAKVDGEVVFANIREVLDDRNTRPGVTRAAILVWSGQSNNVLLTKHAMHNTKLEEIRLYDVTVKNTNVLTNTFSLNLALTVSASYIDNIAYNVVQKASADTECKYGYHLSKGKCIDIDECSASETCYNDGTCINRDGSFVCPCRKTKNPACLEMMDIDVAVLLDVSNAVHKDQFPLLYKLFLRVIKKFYVHPDFIRLSVAAYSDNVEVSTQLDTCKDITCVVKATAGWSYNPHPPNTHTALQIVKSNLLVKGGRRDASKAVIIIGSGSSTERADAMKAIEALWGINVRVYALIYDVEDDVLRHVFSNHFRTYIPFYISDDLSNVDNVHTALGQTIADDAVCSYGKFYSYTSKQCKNVNECVGGNPCLSGEKCFDTATGFDCRYS